MTIAGFQVLPFRFGGLGTASTVAHSDIFTASLPGALAGPGVATTAAHSDVLTAGNVGLYKIAEFVLVAGAASVTFSAIPATYRNLTIYYQAQGDAAATNGAMYGRLNGDSGANYDFYQVNINAAPPSTGSAESIAATSGQIGVITFGTAPANVFTAGRIEIPNYAGTVAQKEAFGLSGLKVANTAGNIFALLNQFHWRNTAAITSIQLFPGAGNFIIGSSFQLYGAM